MRLTSAWRCVLKGLMVILTVGYAWIDVYLPILNSHGKTKLTIFVLLCVPLLILQTILQFPVSWDVLGVSTLTIRQEDA